MESGDDPYLDKIHILFQSQETWFLIDQQECLTCEDENDEEDKKKCKKKC